MDTPRSSLEPKWGFESGLPGDWINSKIEEEIKWLQLYQQAYGNQEQQDKNRGYKEIQARPHKCAGNGLYCKFPPIKTGRDRTVSKKRTKAILSIDRKEGNVMGYAKSSKTI